MSRFDYVAYDSLAEMKQAIFKTKFQEIEALLDKEPNGRSKSLALTSLEEAYMWFGKAIRDDQIARNGSAPLQQSRG